MQGLNWLLNVLDPQPTTTTRRPRKPKKPKKPPVTEELLANSPTHITPVVTKAPDAPNALSQADIQNLIKQLEGLQKDPAKQSLDLSQIKSLQTLINVDEGVQVQANGEHGATSRRTTTERATTASTTKRKKVRKSTTQAPILSVSNSVDDSDEDFDPTTKRPRAPIGFKPVPGVDDGQQSDPLIRGNLLTAAVNVTKAISGFLGSALQVMWSIVAYFLWYAILFNLSLELRMKFLRFHFGKIFPLNIITVCLRNFVHKLVAKITVFIFFKHFCTASLKILLIFCRMQPFNSPNFTQMVQEL